MKKLKKLDYNVSCNKKNIKIIIKGKQMKLSLVFSNNIKKLLATHGWSYTTLAEKCDLSKAYVSNFRKGDINPTFEVVEKIAEAFDITPQQLLNPEMDYNRAAEVPEGYKRKEYLVTEMQDFTISKWEENNKMAIIRLSREKFNRLESLKK